MKEERRQHPRAESDCIASIQREERSLDAVIIDISHTGISVCCDHKFIPGEEVRIAIKLEDRLPLVIDAKVIWARILSPDETCGLYRIGFHFVDISDVDLELVDFAVSRYLKERSIDWREEKSGD